MNRDDLDQVFELVQRLADTSPILAFLAILVGLILMIGALSKLIEVVAKIIEMVSLAISSGYSIIKGGRLKKEALDRRKQFLRVLATDLSAIAKAEAWNDQHFTDLEAEVEIEGGYYGGALHRLVGRKSIGLRRERSLIRAIDQSSEKCLLLTGDPGAGKSVALRHLAVQMIERSLKSTDESSPVPLYINLREMNVLPDGPVTVDIVRDFVIDNVRRGDADTAEYMKDNWTDFQRKGVWFFLFDSFDEIPAVMHAAANDTAVARYGKSIQQFIDGLGNCRGVLASREYKSPGALVWPKLRILPLSEDKQEELIKRTFLTKEQKTLALRAVSLSSSATYKNPLFLTLLCRYVRQNLFAPTNEHELLYSHVELLSKRDQEYVTSKWGFDHVSLFAGASEIARLFAISPELGLAPTIDEIKLAAGKVDGLLYGGVRLAQLIEALTYVKIGRTDVASIDTSLRRFAFSHRRYQECLFAVYLASNIETIDTTALVIDARWREYLVALLQIANPKSLSGIVDSAKRFLEGKVNTIVTQQRRFLGAEVRTFKWDDKELDHVLSVFLEAKRYFPDGPWLPLEDPIEKIFGRLWTKGDYLDRQYIMKYCGVGSVGVLARRLEFSVSSGIVIIEESAIDACRFLPNPSPHLAAWVRRNVTARIMAARRRFELLRWEAIAAQLPANYDIDVCLERAKSVAPRGPFLRTVVRLVDSIESLMSKLESHSGKSVRRGSAFRGSMLSMKIISLHATYVLIVMLLIGANIVKNGIGPFDVAVLLFLLAGFLTIATYLVRVSCIDVPDKLSPQIVARHWRRAVNRRGRMAGVLLASLVIMSIPGLVVLWVSRQYGFFDGQDAVDIVTGGSFAVLLIVAMGGAVVLRVSSTQQLRAARATLATMPNLQKAIGAASSVGEVLALCEIAVTSGIPSDQARVALSYLTVVHRGLRSRKLIDALPWTNSATDVEVRSAISILLGEFQLSRPKAAIATMNPLILEEPA